ncbi:hypothetical protein [Lentzea sp.]|uniref:hypothetical protein n=1 Tax=Lentzea sp. TaxID=56099 RepID=UPI002ED5CCBF
MTIRPRLIGRLVAALAAVLVVTAAPAGAAPGTGDAFRAGPAVLVVHGQAPDVRVQATPPQSFCYVGVAWPAAIGADWKATATWGLDCRSLADPNAPAPDIFMVLMDVHIYQGVYSPWHEGTEVAHVSCSSGSGPKPTCSATTPAALEFGVPYFTKLRVQVALNGGSNPVGEFYTESIRRT